MIYINILGDIIQSCDFQLDQLDNIIKSIYIFIGSYIDLNVQYILKFNLCFDLNEGRSLEHIIKLKDINELNRFITSDYENMLSNINLSRNEIIRSSKIYLNKECELKDIYVFIEFYLFRPGGNYIGYPY